MHAKPEMIVFDFGGTLWGDGFDLTAGYAAIFRHLAEGSRDIELLPLVQRGRALFEKRHEHTQLEVPQEQFLRLFFALEDIKLAPHTTFEALIYDFWTAAEPVVLKEGITEALAALRERKIRLGVISNNSCSGALIQRRLDEGIPGNGFEFVVSSCDYMYRKPGAELFKVAERLAGLEPAQLWYCGNSFSADVRGAAGAHWFPVWYNDEENAPPEDAAQYDYLEIRHWRELVQALTNA